MKFIKPRDIIIIICIVAVAFIFWLLRPSTGRYVEIYDGTNLVMTAVLGEEREFIIPGKPHVIFCTYKDGSVAIISSDCPDKLCVKTGRISRKGQTAVCLPNKIVLKVTSDEA